MPKQDTATTTGGTDDRPLRSVRTADLLIELGRRFRIHFGKIEVAFHDGRPSQKIVVEQRIQYSLEGAADDRRPPVSTGGHT
jgi:hypothetical protein